MKKMLLLITMAAIAFLGAGTALAETITIVGTGSGAAVLKSMGKVFNAQHPDVKVEVPKSIGSGGGFKAVGTDKNVLGRVAREPNEKEKAYGLTYLPYAKNPIVFFVNPSVGIKDLTPKQVCDIYSGKITNWKDVGGPDAKIRVIRREEGDSSLQVLRKSFPGFSEITLTKKSKTTFSDPSTCELVENKENTIAFGTYANARNHNVNILTIDGKKVSDPDYLYVGTLALVFKDKNKTGHVDKFIDFATSKAAREAIRAAGSVPL